MSTLVGIEFDPAAHAAPGPHPGVHRVGALQPRFARRRVGAQEARDIAGRHPDVAQAGDHDVAKSWQTPRRLAKASSGGVSTSVASGSNSMSRWRAWPMAAHRFKRGHAGRELARGHRRRTPASARHAGWAPMKWCGRIAAPGRDHVGDLLGRASEVGEMIEAGRLGQPLDPRDARGTRSRRGRAKARPRRRRCRRSRCCRCVRRARADIGQRRNDGAAPGRSAGVRRRR